MTKGTAALNRAGAGLHYCLLVPTGQVELDMSSQVSSPKQWVRVLGTC